MPALTEPEAETAEKTPPELPFARRLLISLIRFAVVVGIAAMLGGGWYMAHKGFGREWRQRVVDELHKRGVEASVAHLTIDPFRGLVARDVQIYDYKHRENVVAVISEVSLDINYAALLHHQPFLNALDVRDAQLTLPMAAGQAQPGAAQLTKFRAHVYFPPEQIYVSQAEGLFCGVRISATGQLIKRADYQPSRVVSEEEWQQRMQLLQRVAAELQAFNFAGGPPTFQAKFS